MGNLLLLIHLYFNLVILLHPHMMINLYQTSPNMSSIGGVCDSLGNTFLGATGGLRLNLSPVKVKLIIFPLFLPKGNAILPITPKEVCEICLIFFFRLKKNVFQVNLQEKIPWLKLINLSKNLTWRQILWG